MKRDLPAEIADELVKVDKIRQSRYLVLVDNKPVGERNRQVMALQYAGEFKATIGHVSIRTLNICIEIAKRHKVPTALIEELEGLLGVEDALKI